MDHQWFDNLTRAFASDVSRRESLKLLGGSLAAGCLRSLRSFLLVRSRMILRTYRNHKHSSSRVLIQTMSQCPATS